MTLKNRWLFAIAILTLVGATPALRAQPPLGNPPVPEGNPITEPKRLLGKILFWDEQLSSSNTVSCGTCHAPAGGGGDPRRVRGAGPDGVLFTADDVFTSPGLIGADGSNDFSPVPTGGVLFASQVTPRTAQSAYMGAFSALNFWDGRAGPEFVDPQTSTTVLPDGGALEAQSLQPPLSRVEMAHFGRGWADVVAKISAAAPLALADQVPDDVTATLAGAPNYPVLFGRAFGTPEVTAARIAMAIATYERTLVPNQTPWDRFAGGEFEALTSHQLTGLDAINSARGKCLQCHSGNAFTDNDFHNIGIRPYTEDPGRESVSGDAADRGKFKTPTLRNVGLRSSFFHNGQATTLRQVVDFYTRAPGALPQFSENLDPAMEGINLVSSQADAIVDFLTNALTDPRTAASLPPFDHPRLWSQRAELLPVSLGGGTAGPGSSVPPLMIAADPALIGEQCRLGVGNAQPGWHGVLRISAAAPVGGQIFGGEILPGVTITDEGAGTVRLLIDPVKYAPGVGVYVQWEFSVASGGAVIARSDVARIVPFCGRAGCPNLCAADLGGPGGLPTPDGQLDNNDFIAFITYFFQQAPQADMGAAGGLPGQDGQFNNNDFIAFITRFFQGC